MLNIQKARFIKSAAAKTDFLFDGRPLVILAGRSNVGKSSIINSLLNRKNFARVGASPGKTSQVNYFLIDERLYLVDLPGYGYAKRSFNERERWAALINEFFQMCGQIRCSAYGLLVIDARHGPLDNDHIMADYYAAAGIPALIVANKCDKLTKNAFSAMQREIATAFPEGTDILMYSAEKGSGRAELLSRISDFEALSVTRTEGES